MRKFTYGLPIALLSAAVVVVHPHKAVASIPPQVRAIARSAVPEAIASDVANDAIAYYNRGLARYKLGDKQGAIDNYNHGLNINPNFPQAYKGRGLTRSELRDNHGAINDLSRGFETR